MSNSSRPGLEAPQILLPCVVLFPPHSQRKSLLPLCPKETSTHCLEGSFGQTGQKGMKFNFTGFCNEESQLRPIPCFSKLA